MKPVVRRIATHLLLEPGDVAPSRDGVEVVGVFNPGAAELDGSVVLLVRVAERPRARDPGWTALPRVDPSSGALVIDRIRDDDIEVIDSRVVRLRRDGRVRLTSVSHMRVVRLDGEPEWGPGVRPAGPLEEYGVEDPRITRLDGRYRVTYVAVSRHGVATALASTDDFEVFERHGAIFCPENKDVILFPKRLPGEEPEGAYAALHRPVGATPFTPPEIWTARSQDLLRWGRHRPLRGLLDEADDDDAWQAARVGAGPPPIRTKRGWLLVYHGSRRAGAGEIGAYAAGALLLDDAGERIIGRARGPVLVPEERWEREGFVPDVVFPTGAVLRDDVLRLYYGAADCRCGMVELSLAEVLAAIG